MTTNIDDDVALVTEQIHALKRLGDQISVSDSEIYDFSIRWGTVLAGRLPRLTHYRAHGLLDDADEHRFQSLCEELRAVAPLAARLGVALPAVPESPTETV